MEQYMQMKTWRGKLLLSCIEKGLSYSTRLEIAKYIGAFHREQGEMLAQKAITIVEELDDEQEILQKIKSLAQKS